MMKARGRNQLVVAKSFLVIFMAAAMLSLGGCGTNLLQYYFGDTFGGSDTTEKTADQLAWEGIQKMQDKDYDDALKAFQTLKERYPYSKYASLAELKVGDAYFHKKEYADAALAYEEFVRLHPRNEVVPYVLYQMGMCHFLSFSSIDRDMEETRLAMDSFQRLIRAFPDSPFSQKARKRLFECRKRLAQHEFYVARIYYRMHEYQAAMIRLERLQKHFPKAVEELGYQKKIEEMNKSCGVCLNKNPYKRSFWSRIGF